MCQTSYENNKKKSNSKKKSSNNNNNRKDIESSPLYSKYKHVDDDDDTDSDTTEITVSTSKSHNYSEDDDDEEELIIFSSSSSSSSNDNNNKSLSVRFKSLTSLQQGILLTLSLFLFSSTNNLLQEAITQTPDFQYGVMIGYIPVFGVTLCSYIERTYYSSNLNTRRSAPLQSYISITLCLWTSCTFSNMSLNYINFPTKVIFRSCKLIPTMILASILHGKSFSITEYTSALAICIGLVLFAAADWTTTPDFDIRGIGLVSTGVCADALLTNCQDRLFRSGSSRSEVTFYSSVFALGGMTLTTVLSGDLVGFMSHALQDHYLLSLVMAYTIMSYVAISTYMNVVKRFGGVVAVLISTARKGMTLLLSFVVFPKPFSWYYVSGAMMVLGGLLISSLVRHKMKRRKEDGDEDCTVNQEESSRRMIRKRSKSVDYDHDDDHHWTGGEEEDDDVKDDTQDERVAFIDRGEGVIGCGNCPKRRRILIKENNSSSSSSSETGSVPKLLVV